MVVTATKLLVFETFKGIKDSFNVVSFFFSYRARHSCVRRKRDSTQLARVRMEERVTKRCAIISYTAILATGEHWAGPGGGVGWGGPRNRLS